MTTHEFTYSVQDAIKHLKPSALKLTRNTEEANDLLQETFLKAYDQRGKFSEGSNLRAWMYTLMKNIFINNYQRMLRRKTFLDNTELQFFVNHPGNDDRMRREVYNTVTRSEIKKALKSLDSEQRKPFILYFRGYKYNEIAQKLNIPLGTVKTRIHNARKYLQIHLKDYQLT